MGEIFLRKNIKWVKRAKIKKKLIIKFKNLIFAK